MTFPAFLKSVFVFSLLFLIFFLVKTPAFAQSVNAVTPVVQTQPNLMPNTNPDVPQNLHTFSQSLMLEIMSSFACNLSGRDPLSKDGRCLNYDPTTGKIGYAPNNGGAIGSIGSMIAVLYSPPLHTSDFIAYMQQNFGLAKPTYAQITGIGFQGLNPLLKAWAVFRNIVYLIFVFAFVLIGLAIMLRVKIDPRTVMTIQNQIPKIIISLVLVTFSFAIAGFLIDLMWLSIYVVINVMSQADPNIVVASVNAGVYHPAPQFANDVLTGGFPSLGGIHSIAFNGAGAIAAIVQKFISPDTLPPVAASSSTTSAGAGGGCFALGCIPVINVVVNAAAGVVNTVLGAVGDVLGGFFSNVISWVVGLLAYLILIIALIWALLRLWFALLKAYIMILIDVIFAPFWIIAGLIPGQQSAGFGGWLKDMAGNLAAFPAAIMMFLLAKLFSDSFISAGTTGTNTFTGNISGSLFIPPLIGSNGFGYMPSLVALGVVLATPSVVDMTKKAFKAPKLELGMIGTAAGAAPRIAGKTFGTVMQGMSAGYYAKQFGLFGGGKGPAASQPEVAHPGGPSTPR